MFEYSQNLFSTDGYPRRWDCGDWSRGIQFMIRRMLDDCLETVTIVENGELAIAELQRAVAADAPYHVLLMDMQMPVMNGFDATARARDLGFELPIIALTAGAMCGDRERCLSVGCNDYVAKPIDRQQLLSAISNQYNQGVCR